MRVGLVALARAPEELAEPEMAVGDEWTHPEVIGKSQRFSVAIFGLVDVRRIPMRGHLGEEAERPSLGSSMTALSGQGEALQRQGQCLATGAAHSSQDFAPVSFSCWHREHFIVRLACPPAWMSASLCPAGL